MKEVAEFTDRFWYSVDKIKDIREATDGFEILVGWKRLTTPGDSWEPLTVMFEDVPFKVRDLSSTAVSTRFFAVLALPSDSRRTVGDCYASLTTAAPVAAVARPGRAASSIWWRRRYQTMIPGRPGWSPYLRVPFNSLFVLANIPDCI